MRRFIVLSLIFVALVSSEASASVLEGKINTVNPRDRWLSILSPDGIIFLVVHPQGVVLKKGGRVTLFDYAPGEEIAALASGIRNGSTVLILALEDRATYESSKGVAAPTRPPQPENAKPKNSDEKTPQDLSDIDPRVWEMVERGKLPMPKGFDWTPPSLPNGAAGTEKSPSSDEPTRQQKPFLQIDGKIESIDEDNQKFVLNQSRGVDTIQVAVVDKTKIYSYTKAEFHLLNFARLSIGKRVRVGGFRQDDSTIEAESVLVLPNTKQKAKS